ncbi:MAG: ribonuclease H [Acidimicrobiales bacterium]
MDVDAAPRPPGQSTVVYTDGSCLGNPGPGGWAWAVPDGRQDSGGEPRTTNQRMELTAVVRALEALPGPAHVMSDSTYVVNCFRQRWWEGWQRRRWRNAQGKPVANRDLWESLLALALDPGRPVSFGWVKGHSGDPMNDLVDLLATTAAAHQPR